jgi:hypothetical protein
VQRRQRLRVRDLHRDHEVVGQRLAERGRGQRQRPARAPPARPVVVAAQRAEPEAGQRGEGVPRPPTPGRSAAAPSRRPAHGPLALRRRGGVGLGGAAASGCPPRARGRAACRRAPLGLGQPGVGDVAHQCVAKGVGTGLGLRLEQPPVDQGLDGRAHHRRVAVARGAADGLQPGERQAHAEHAGVAQHALGRSVQAVDAGGEHGLHTGRQHVLGQCLAEHPPVVLSAQHPPVDQQVQQLGQEERVALRAGQQRAAHPGVEVVAGGAEVGVQQPLGRGLLQRQHRHQLGVGEPGDPRRPRRPGSRGSSMSGGRRRAAAPGPRTRRATSSSPRSMRGRPVQVVDDQHQRPSAASAVNSAATAWRTWSPPRRCPARRRPARAGHGSPSSSPSSAAAARHRPRHRPP